MVSTPDFSCCRSVVTLEPVTSSSRAPAASEIALRFPPVELSATSFSANWPLDSMPGFPKLELRAKNPLSYYNTQSLWDGGKGLPVSSNSTGGGELNPVC